MSSSYTNSTTASASFDAVAAPSPSYEATVAQMGLLRRGGPLRPTEAHVEAAEVQAAHARLMARSRRANNMIQRPHWLGSSFRAERTYIYRSDWLAARGAVEDQDVGAPAMHTSLDNTVDFNEEIHAPFVATLEVADEHGNSNLASFAALARSFSSLNITSPSHSSGTLNATAAGLAADESSNSSVASRAGGSTLADLIPSHSSRTLFESRSMMSFSPSTATLVDSPITWTPWVNVDSQDELAAPGAAIFASASSGDLASFA